MFKPLAFAVALLASAPLHASGAQPVQLDLYLETERGEKLVHTSRFVPSTTPSPITAGELLRCRGREVLTNALAGTVHPLPAGGYRVALTYSGKARRRDCAVDQTAFTGDVPHAAAGAELRRGAHRLVVTPIEKPARRARSTASRGGSSGKRTLD